MKERGTKWDKRSRVNIYASNILYIQNKIIQVYFFSPLFKAIYEIKDAPHKQTTQRDADNNRTEDIDTCRKRDNN